MGAAKRGRKMFVNRILVFLCVFKNFVDQKPRQLREEEKKLTIFYRIKKKRKPSHRRKSKPPRLGQNLQYIGHNHPTCTLDQSTLS
jgi:hypothetical protein